MTGSSRPDRCETCRFFHGDPNPEHDNHECRRYAPQATTQPATDEAGNVARLVWFPVVLPDMWCGEWQAKLAPPLPTVAASVPEDPPTYDEYTNAVQRMLEMVVNRLPWPMPSSSSVDNAKRALVHQLWERIWPGRFDMPYTVRKHLQPPMALVEAERLIAATDRHELVREAVATVPSRRSVKWPEHLKALLAVMEARP